MHKYWYLVWLSLWHGSWSPVLFKTFFLGFLTSVNPFWRPFFRKPQKFIKWRWFSLLSQGRHFCSYILMAGGVKFVTCLENSSSKFNRPVTENFGIISTVLYQVVVTELFWSKQGSSFGANLVWLSLEQKSPWKLTQTKIHLKSFKFHQQNWKNEHFWSNVVLSNE